eukprot:93735-Amphidinium_carterae.1
MKASVRATITTSLPMAIPDTDVSVCVSTTSEAMHYHLVLKGYTTSKSDFGVVLLGFAATGSLLLDS